MKLIFGQIHENLVYARGSPIQYVRIVGQPNILVNNFLVTVYILSPCTSWHFLAAATVSTTNITDAIRATMYLLTSITVNYVKTESYKQLVTETHYKHEEG